MLQDAAEITYSYLKTMVRNWLNRDDLKDELIEDFISLAERKIFRQLRSPMNEESIIIAPPLEKTNRIVIPGDFLEMKDLNIDGIDYKFKPFNIWNTYISCHVYTRELAFIYVKPDISTTAKIKLNYYYDASGMNEDAETNNVLRTCPDLYLYASLIQAETFLINDERIPLWKGLYDVTLEEVNRGYRNMDYRGNLVIMEKN